jgi:hypothetical protein
MAQSTAPAASGNGTRLVLAWGFVGIPLAWGIYKTLLNALLLFQ